MSRFSWWGLPLGLAATSVGTAWAQGYPATFAPSLTDVELESVKVEILEELPRLAVTRLTQAESLRSATTPNAAERSLRIATDVATRHPYEVAVLYGSLPTSALPPVDLAASRAARTSEYMRAAAAASAGDWSAARTGLERVLAASTTRNADTDLLARAAATDLRLGYAIAGEFSQGSEFFVGHGRWVDALDLRRTQLASLGWALGPAEKPSADAQNVAFFAAIADALPAVRGGPVPLTRPAEVPGWGDGGLRTLPSAGCPTCIGKGESHVTATMLGIPSGGGTTGLPKLATWSGQGRVRAWLGSEVVRAIRTRLDEPAGSNPFVQVQLVEGSLKESTGECSGRYTLSDVYGARAVECEGGVCTAPVWWQLTLDIIVKAETEGLGVFVHSNDGGYTVGLPPKYRSLLPQFITRWPLNYEDNIGDDQDDAWARKLAGGLRADLVSWLTEVT